MVITKMWSRDPVCTTSFTPSLAPIPSPIHDSSDAPFFMGRPQHSKPLHRLHTLPPTSWRHGKPPPCFVWCNHGYMSINRPLKPLVPSNICIARKTSLINRLAGAGGGSGGNKRNSLREITEGVMSRNWKALENVSGNRFGSCSLEMYLESVLGI